MLQQDLSQKTHIKNSPEPREALCLHCGKPTAGADSSFCCIGCETVYHLLQTTEFPQGVLSRTSPIQDEKTWEYLAEKSFSEVSTQHRGARTARFFIENVHCTSCLWILEKLPEYVEGLLDCKFNMGQGVLTVLIDETSALPKVACVLDAIGFTPHIVRENEDFSEVQKKDIKKLQKRLAVAAFCSGNIMLLSVSIYAGLEGYLKDYFEWISFLLFLPVLLYSSQDFFRTSWVGIQRKKPSIDWPIALALLIGGGLSGLNLIKGNGVIYFDSLSALVALLLGARLFLRSIQKKYLVNSHLRKFLSDQRVLIWDRGLNDWMEKSAEEVKPGDRVLIRQDQRIPVDAKLLSENALIDPSALSGESLPQLFSHLDLLFAGQKIVDGEVEIQALSDVKQSKIGRMLQKVEDQVFAKTQTTELTDEVSKWFTLGILLVSVMVVGYFSFSQFEEGMQRALALVIIACPCALAFATPLVQSLALTRSSQNGVLVKSAETLEKVSQIKSIFFDKTGTLTTGRLKVLDFLSERDLTQEQLNILYSLELKSSHPIARSLTHYLREKNVQVVELQNYKETIGKGVEGKFQGKKYEVCSFNEKGNSENSRVGFFCEKELLCKVSFGDEILFDAKEVVSYFKKQDIDVQILSGDDDLAVGRVAKELGIPVFAARQTPEEKALRLSTNAMMVGDGINDLLSMSKAAIGVAVKGTVSEGLKTSDVYLTEVGLTPLMQLHQISKKSYRLIWQNILFSIFYNVTGAAFALSGLVNPLVAAVLMPISSTLVVASSVIGARKFRGGRG